MVTLLLSSIVIFAMVRFIPGDPVSARLTDGGLSNESLAALKQLYGLNQPVYVQYWSWVTALLHGNFGESFITQTPVINEVTTRVIRTLYLAAAGVLCGLLIAIPVAIVSARYAGHWVDSALNAIVGTFIATPNYVIGLILILIFAVSLRLVPVAGYVDPASDLWQFLRSLFLPALTIGLPAGAVIARVLRTSLLEEIQRDYFRTAQAWGASRIRALVRHALRNASIPAVTVLGLQIGYLLGGAVLVESVFSYPGLGLLLLTSITQRDYPTVQISLAFFAVAFVIVNLATDLVSVLLNPRLKVS